MCASSIGFVPDPTGSLPGLGSNSEITAASAAAGTTTLTRTSANTVAVLTVSGAASTRTVVLSTTGAEQGDRMTLKVILPATANILVDLRNATAGGTQIDTYTSDGAILSMAWEVYFDGAAWKYLRAQVPA